MNAARHLQFPGNFVFGEHTIAPRSTWSATAQTTLNAPHLWAPGSPYLYKARLTLSDSKGAISRATSLAGVRKIAITPTGQMELNGRILHLRGSQPARAEPHDRRGADDPATRRGRRLDA